MSYIYQIFLTHINQRVTFPNYTHAKVSIACTKCTQFLYNNNNNNNNNNNVITSQVLLNYSATVEPFLKTCDFVQA
jgi:hypothetical protein